MIISVATLPLIVGNTSKVFSAFFFWFCNIINALLDSGTRCSILAFILSAGTVHKHDSKSISSHCINLTSPERAAVRIKNSSIIAPRLGLLVAFSIVATKSGKSCHGIDG